MTMDNWKGRSNHAKGKSFNPEGRPRGQTSLEAFYEDPERFLIRHIRWDRFCMALSERPYTGAAAARKAGYSHKSARFIASRLRKKPVIRAIIQRFDAMVYLYSVTNDMEFARSGDVVEKRRQMEARLEEYRRSKRG